MDAHTLAGMDLDRLEKLLEHKRRSELLYLIHSLVTVEPHISVKTFSQRRHISTKKVCQLIKEGKLRAYLPVDNSYRIPMSAIRDFDRRTEYNGPAG